MNHQVSDKGIDRFKQLVLIVPAAIALYAAITSCDESTQTEGKRITLRLETPQTLSTTFTNAEGWSVTLTTAKVSLGALYFFDGEPLEARTLRKKKRQFSWIPSAYAHPGHYVSGNAMGQLLSPSTINWLEGRTDLGTAQAVTGFYRSVRWVFGPPIQKEFSAIVVAEGLARKSGTDVRFRMTASGNDVLNVDGLPHVDGCVFASSDIQSDAIVRVDINVPVWFDQVDFSRIGVQSSGPSVDAGIDAHQAQLDSAHSDTTPVQVVADSPAHRAFVRGLMKGAAYQFSQVDIRKN